MNILSPEVLFPIALGIGYFFFFLFKEFRLHSYFACNQNFENPSANPVGISVIIACKNEERNIPGLLLALESLDYPTDKCEFIIVDDASTDRTLELLVNHTSQYKNIRVIKAGNKLYPAKKGALNEGINKALFENIMITDADCRPGKNWLLSANQGFANKNEVIFGIAPYWNEVQFIKQFFCYEQFAATTQYLSAAIAGHPYSAAARNFGFTKAVYNELGGFSSTLQSLGGDDDLFLLAALKSRKQIGVIPVSDQSLPFSEAPQNWNAYLSQRSRHVKTSHNYLFSTKVFLTLFHWVNYVSLFSLFLWWVSPAFIFPTIVKIVGDGYLAKKYERLFSYKFTLLRMIPFVFLYELTIPLNFANSLFRRDKWK